MVLYVKTFIFLVRNHVVRAFIVEISSVNSIFGIFVLRFGCTMRKTLRCLHNLCKNICVQGKFVGVIRKEISVVKIK